MVIFSFIIVNIKTKRGNRDSHKAEEYTTKKQCYFNLTPLSHPLHICMYTHNRIKGSNNIISDKYEL